MLIDRPEYVVDHYNRQLVNEDGKFVLAEDLKYYTCVDGKEVEISPYGRTKSIEVMGLISKNDLNQFLPEAVYEVWSETADMWNLAKHLHDNQKVAVAKFSFGKFKESMALIYPVMNGGKYVLAMVLTTTKLTFERWMDVHLAKKEVDKLPKLNELIAMRAKVKREAS